MLDPVTPKELTIELWGRAAAADPKGPAQRLIRKVARELWGNVPGGRWDFNEAQAAAIRARVPSTPPG